MAKNKSKENNKKILFAVIIVLLVAFAVYAFSSSPQFGPRTKKVSQSSTPQPPVTDRGFYETVSCGDAKSAPIRAFCYPVDSSPVELFSEVDVTCTKESYYQGLCNGLANVTIQNEQNACGSIGTTTGPTVEKCDAKVQGTLDYYKCGVYPPTCVGMDGVKCLQSHTGPGCHVSSSIGGYGELNVTTTPAGFCRYTCSYKHPQVIADGLLEISCAACLNV